jgi:hypothetical protein
MTEAEQIAKLEEEVAGLKDALAQTIREKWAIQKEARSAAEIFTYTNALAKWAMWGEDGMGTNAAATGAIMEWAAQQIEREPGAKNYLALTLQHAQNPGIRVVITIEREGMEGPALRADRLAKEVSSLRDDVVAAAVEADRLRIAIKAAVDALPESSAELVAEALRDALAGDVSAASAARET